jgi:hypothetical protein
MGVENCAPDGFHGRIPFARHTGGENEFDDPVQMGPDRQVAQCPPVQIIFGRRPSDQGYITVIPDEAKCGSDIRALDPCRAAGACIE